MFLAFKFTGFGLGLGLRLKHRICQKSHIRQESLVFWPTWYSTNMLHIGKLIFNSTFWHLGTSLTISLLPLTSLRDFVCVPHTDISLLYLAVHSIHTAVGRFQLPVRRSGIRCRAS